MIQLQAIRAAAVAGAAAVLSGVCDGGELILAPEVEASFSFEAGMEGWQPDAADVGDPPVAWSVDSDGQESVDGDRALLFELEGAPSRPAVWVQQAFTVEPNTAYRVRASFSFGSSDRGGDTPWRVVAGVHLDPPRVSENLALQGDTGVQGEEGVVWREEALELNAHSGADGRLWIALGVASTSDGVRRYFLDDVEIRFIRR